MRYLLLIIFLFSQQTWAKQNFYTHRQIIEIEIALCDQLPKNRIFRCLMEISQ